MGRERELKWVRKERGKRETILERYYKGEEGRGAKEKSVNGLKEEGKNFKREEGL